MSQIGKWILLAGVVLVMLGLVMIAGERLGLGRLGLGRLPGDLRFSRGGVQVYFPITSALLLSAVLTLLLNLGRILFRR
jgi:hypothetical protein